MPNSFRLSRRASTAACGLRLRLQHDAEQAGGAAEIPLPDRVAGIGFERRMQNPDDLGPGRKPARHLQAGAIMLREPDGQRAHPAQREKDVGPAQTPSRRIVSAMIGHAPALAEIVPNMMSECPPIYLVAA